MKINKSCALLIFTTILFISCNNDDDDNVTSVPARDAAEQLVDETEILNSYLRTHFIDSIDNPANPNYKIITFDTIAGENAERTSIFDSGLLESKTVTRDDVEYTLYIINYRRGAPSARKPTFADSTYVTYRGELLYDNEDEDGDGIPDEADVDADGDGSPDTDEEDGVTTTRTDADGDGIQDIADIDIEGNDGDIDGDGIIDEYDPVNNNDVNRRVFDSAVTPVWFDLVGLIDGFRESITEFRGASGVTVNNDGTSSYNMDFGNFTVIMPSGLGYFNGAAPSGGIPVYSPLIFTIQLYTSNEADHDRDHVPSYLEDLDGDRLLIDADDDTDGDNFVNYLDTDDDGDGTSTVDEDLEPDSDLSVDRDGDGDPTNDYGDGDPTNDDTDGDGIPNYLDPDDSQSRDLL